MGKLMKKCLACGTLNRYEAKECKECQCVLLADVDQDDQILFIDPMEVALDDAVSSAEQGDEMVAQILREQADKAKTIVAKEMEKEERKQKQASKAGSGSGFGLPAGEQGGSSFGFSIGGEGAGGTQKAAGKKAGGSSGGFGSFGRTDGTSDSRGSGFKISGSEYRVMDEEEPGKVHLGVGSLRMQAIRQNKAGNSSE